MAVYECERGTDWVVPGVNFVGVQNPEGEPREPHERVDAQENDDQNGA